MSRRWLRCANVERVFARLCDQDAVAERLLSIPGVGVLTAPSASAALVDVQRYPTGRHLASWLGLTAREHSSGERRHLGRISKHEDRHLRTLLIHGARAVLLAARPAERRGKPLDRLRSWALQTQQRCGRYKAAVARANKRAWIIRATWHH